MCMPLNPELGLIHDFVAAEVAAVGMADLTEVEVAPTMLAAIQANDECVPKLDRLGS